MYSTFLAVKSTGRRLLGRPKSKCDKQLREIGIDVRISFVSTKDRNYSRVIVPSGSMLRSKNNVRISFVSTKDRNY